MISKLPDGWLAVPLSEIAHEVQERNPHESNIPVLSVTKYDGFVLSLEYFKKQIFSKDTSNYKLVRKGQFAYATIHLDEGSIDLLDKFDCGLISPMYTVFEPDSKRVDLNYLRYQMKSGRFLQMYARLGQGSINRRKSISFNTLEAITIPLPLFTEQQKITAILNSVDEAIASTQAVINQTRKVKQGILQQLLTRGIGHTRFKESAIGRIPERWEAVQLSKVCSKITDGVHKKPNYVSKGIPFITIKNLTFSSGINFSDVNFITKEDHKEFIKRTHPEKGDVLLTKDGTLGIPRVIETDTEFSIFVSLALLKPIREVLDSYFLCQALESPIVSSQLLLNQAGSALKHIHLIDLRSSWIPLPSLEEQLAIVERIRSIDDLINYSLSQLNSLSQIKQGLMQDLLTGRVRVGGTP
jgi:type I restriction enzyme S subunit